MVIRGRVRQDYITVETSAPTLSPELFGFNLTADGATAHHTGRKWLDVAIDVAAFVVVVRSASFEVGGDLGMGRARF